MSTFDIVIIFCATLLTLDIVLRVLKVQEWVRYMYLAVAIIVFAISVVVFTTHRVTVVYVS